MPGTPVQGQQPIPPHTHEFSWDVHLEVSLNTKEGYGVP